MRLSVKVDGLKEIEAALAGIEKAATRKTVARNALKRAGAPVASAMEAKAAKDEGDLAGSVVVSTKIKGEAGKAEDGSCASTEVRPDGARRAPRRWEQVARGGVRCAAAC